MNTPWLTELFLGFTTFFEIRNWYACFSLASKEVQRILRIWQQTIAPPVLHTLLYLFIFGEVIGKRVGMLEGASYTQFILPGLIVNLILLNASGNVSTSFFSAKLYHTLEDLLVAPIPDWAIILGYLTGGIIRSVLVSALTLFSLNLYQPLHIAHWKLLWLIIVLSSVMFSMLGLLTAQLANSMDQLSTISTFILTPLSYLSGSFYSAEMLSPFWQTCFNYNPIAYLVSTARYACLGKGSFSLQGTVIGMVVSSLILYSWIRLELRRKNTFKM